MKKGTVITLTPEEKNFVVEGGRLRYLSCRNAGVYNARVGNQSDAFTDQNGLAGELAFCKGFDISRETLSIGQPKSSQKGEDQDGDVTLPNGMTVDVKTTHWEDGRLIAATWKEGSGVDLYALMTGDLNKGNSFVFRGFIKSNDLIQEDNLEYPGGYGKAAYTAYQFELVDLDQINQQGSSNVRPGTKQNGG